MLSIRRVSCHSPRRRSVNRYHDGHSFLTRETDLKLIRPLTLIWLAALAPSIHAGGMPIDKGRTLAATCANCHGTDGHSVGGTESLAGVPRDTLLRKLSAFSRGEKPATIMHQIAEGYTPEQLTLIAEHFAAQRARTGH